MKLECVKEFGNFEPGDTVEVPDGAEVEFDTFYFKVAVEAPAKTADKESK